MFCIKLMYAPMLVLDVREGKVCRGVMNWRLWLCGSGKFQHGSAYGIPACILFMN